MFAFIKRLTQNRPGGGYFRKFLPGLPAALVCLAWVPFALVLLSWTPLHVRGYYVDMANASLARKNFETARVAFERLLYIGSTETNAHIFGLAQCLGGLGQTNEAMELLRRLTPLGPQTDFPGYAPAHLFVAEQYISYLDRSETINPIAIISAAMNHLAAVTNIDHGNLRAHELMGGLHLRRQQPVEAKAELLKVVNLKPDLSLTLAYISQTLGDDEAAQNWAERAISYFRNQVAARPKDQRARLNLAKATLIAKKRAEALELFESALSELERGISILPSNKQNEQRVFVAQECANWIAMLAKDDPKDLDLGSRVKYVQRGILVWPFHEPLLRQLIAFSQLKGPESAAARTQLNELLAQGKSSAILHMCLGLNAWELGEIEDARQHFSRAFALAPQVPTVANNMALILAFSKNPDLPRALNIIQAILDKNPENPGFRESRGQILLKMEKYQEALADLEFALPFMPEQDKLITHRSMAIACEKLGLKDLAEAHKRLARPLSPATAKSAGKAN